MDEVNRLPPAKLSILYQIVDRGMTKYGSEVHKVSEGPLFATANAPDSGNFPLPLPFRDRFDIGVIATELNPQYIQRLGTAQPMPDLGHSPTDARSWDNSRYYSYSKRRN